MNNKGFTIIETLISLIIITTVVFIPLVILSNYLKNNEITLKSIEARLKAREVIERVRHIRDTNILSGEVSFFQNLTSEELRGCLVEDFNWDEDDRSGIKYCSVNRDADGKLLNTNTFNNIKSEIVKNTNTETCDGKDPKEDGEISETVQILYNTSRLGVNYILVVSCVSFEGRNKIRKIELREAMFDWLVDR